jgi:hypothetical protein
LASNVLVVSHASLAECTVLLTLCPEWQKAIGDELRLRCGYPGDFGRYEKDCNGRNKRQSRSYRANRPEWSLLNVEGPSEPIYDPLATEDGAGKE